MQPSQTIVLDTMQLNLLKEQIFFSDKKSYLDLFDNFKTHYYLKTDGYEKFLNKNNHNSSNNSSEPKELKKQSNKSKKIDLNKEIGNNIQIEFTGDIQCKSCARAIKKTFNGFCYPCFRKLASADICMVKPELCHFYRGTCRQPQWAQDHCMIDHSIYLAISSDLKVGITRRYRRLSRWADQGASYAIELGRVSSRYIAGLTEQILKQKFKDKTNPKKMLTFDNSYQDLVAIKNNTLNTFLNVMEEHIRSNPKKGCGNDIKTDKFFIISDKKPVMISYPMIKKFQSDNMSMFDLKKTNSINGQLIGLKAQYMLIESIIKNKKMIIALNIKKYSGYHIKLNFS